jgi:hypothetical protein
MSLLKTSDDAEQQLITAVQLLSSELVQTRQQLATVVESLRTDVESLRAARDTSDTPLARPRSLTMLWSIALLVGLVPVLIGALTYMLEMPERERRTNYAAWQLVNAAQGQVVSGGRIEALQDLNEDRCLLWMCSHHRVSLQGLTVPNADLQGIILPDAILTKANLQGANLEGANLEGANLDGADLRGTNLKEAKLQGASLQGANLEGALLEEANLQNTRLTAARLRNARLAKVQVSPTRLKTAIDWEHAHYDPETRTRLELPPQP